MMGILTVCPITVSRFDELGVRLIPGFQNHQPPPVSRSIQLFSLPLSVFSNKILSVKAGFRFTSVRQAATIDSL
jgi:hypothetical protein